MNLCSEKIKRLWLKCAKLKVIVDKTVLAFSYFEHTQYQSTEKENWLNPFNWHWHRVYVSISFSVNFFRTIASQQNNSHYNFHVCSVKWNIRNEWSKNGTTGSRAVELCEAKMVSLFSQTCNICVGAYYYNHSTLNLTLLVCTLQFSCEREWFFLPFFIVAAHFNNTDSLTHSQ